MLRELKASLKTLFESIRAREGFFVCELAKLYEINRATQAELERIRNDATLSSDEKIEALATTRTEQQKAIQQLLGPEAFPRWLQTQH